MKQEGNVVEIQKCNVVEIKLPKATVACHPDLIGDIEKLKESFSRAVVGRSDGDDVTEAEPVKIYVLYVPISQCSIMELKQQVVEWMGELGRKYPDDRRPNVAVFPIIRARVPWEQSADAAERITVEEAETILDTLNQGASTEEYRGLVKRLKELLIPERQMPD